MNKKRIAFGIVGFGLALAAFALFPLRSVRSFAAETSVKDNAADTAPQHKEHAHEKGKGHTSHKDAEVKGKVDEHGHEDEKAIRLSEEKMKEFGIEVAVATSGQLNTTLQLPGAVAANGDRLAHVVPHLAGVVREVRKNLGDSVRQGELMAVIESRTLADAKAEYLASTEKAQLAQAKFSREERLWQKKISAEQEYLDAKQALAEARIAVRSAEQKLHALGFSDAYLKDLPRHRDTSYTRYEIVAPFNGTVIDKHITLGEVLKEDADAFIVADLTTVWINLNVYQKDLPLIQTAQKAIISAGFGIPDAEGTISYVAPIIKEETRTALARVILPNPKGLWRPGTFVTAKVAIDASIAPIVIPKSALQNMDEKPIVFVQDEDGFEPRPVTIGRATEDSVEIISGLSNGERFVSKGSFTLKAHLSKGAFGDGHNH